MDDVKEETVSHHCRLCAEPTDITGLIPTDSEEAIHWNLLEKMAFININVEEGSSMPRTVCFSCLDLLQRTWKFLQSVKEAQKILADIYVKLPEGFVLKELGDIKNDEDCPGKPVGMTDRVKSESVHSCRSMASTENCTKIELVHVKEEQDSSSREIVPLKTKKKTSKPKKNKKKVRISTKIDEDDLPIFSLKLLKTRKQKSNFDSTLVDAKKLVSWETIYWFCGKCHDAFSTSRELQAHSIEAHSSCTIFICPMCNRKISFYRTMLKHIREHIPSLQTFCEVCNMDFQSEALLESHNDDHSPNSSNRCKRCGLLINDPQALSDHVLKYCYRVVHKRKHPKPDLENNADLKCSHCEKTFKTKSNLQSHIQLHKERSRDFFCHICGKMFYTKGTLSNHMMTHEDSKPFKCDFCNLSFKALGNLRAHISLHSGTKPFVCDQCGKNFRARRHLKSHLIVHTDLMPFSCQYCGKTFRFKTRLNLHLRQHTGAKPYSCNACQRNFTNGSNYKKHMIRRHNIDVGKKKNVDLIPADKLNTVLTQLKLESV